MKLSVILFGLFLFSLSAVAEWAKIPSKDFQVVAPPAPGSAAYQRDYELLLKHQDERSEENCELSATQTVPTFQNLYGSSRIFSAAEMRAMEPVLSKALNISSRVSGYFKEKFGRPRPYNVDRRVQPCVARPIGSKAYPSSHASMAATGACLLSQLFPTRTDTISSYGDFLGNLRVIVGVHHPSDVAAGKRLGNEVCHRLLSDPGFQRDFSDLRLRIR